MTQEGLESISVQMLIFCVYTL